MSRIAGSFFAATSSASLIRTRSASDNTSNNHVQRIDEELATNAPDHTRIYGKAASEDPAGPGVLEKRPEMNPTDNGSLDGQW